MIQSLLKITVWVIKSLRGIYSIFVFILGEEFNIDQECDVISLLEIGLICQEFLLHAVHKIDLQKRKILKKVNI